MMIIQWKGLAELLYCVFEVKLTFEILICACNSIHFQHTNGCSWESFWNRKCVDLMGTRTPNLQIHAKCSNHLSYLGQTFPVPYFLAATKQLYKWFNPSVCPSVCPSHLFDYVPIIISSWHFQELLPMTKVMSMQKVKVRGQRSRSQRSQTNSTVSGL